MLGSGANEVRRLVESLGSRSATRFESARARLILLGPRAVEELVEALEGDNARVRARAMPILALIQDPRGREPLTAMLLDRNARLRRIAARCLSRFPAAESAAALNRTLQRERNTGVRVAAVQTLVEHYAAGCDSAIRRVLDVLTDTAQPPEIRQSAFALLPHLRPAQRRGLLQRLRDDPSPTIRELARLTDPRAATVGAARDSGAIERLLAALGSDDYRTWNAAVERLGASGARVVPPLVAEMQRRAHDAEYCVRGGMALKALGPRRGRALLQALENVDEPLPLQVLVDVVGALGERSMVYRLQDLIPRIAARAGEYEDGNGFDPLQRVRAKAHLELARIGSRVAIDDLREFLGDPGRRIDLEALAAVERIGKRDELGVLLTAHQREDAFARERIVAAVRTIVKRERLRRNDRMFRSLAPEQRRTLDAILPRGSRRQSKADRSPPRRAP